ncbi:MAG: biopolymer transporter ExbD [Gammaproteobacteria bacterium]|jgi:biopolymer transport protein ExbD|nr:biopolymer transporter ExbD [Gammaproteobacteria bacterium]
MNLRPRRREPPDINLTPLIDVVFLLLIFFMVSTTFNDDARLRLTLPEADGEPAQAGELDLLELVVDVSGRFYVDGGEVLGTDVGTLRRALEEATAGPEAADRPVLIRADAKTPHQAVMTALDALGQLGIQRVAFAASRTDQAP